LVFTYPNNKVVGCWRCELNLNAIQSDEFAGEIGTRIISPGHRVKEQSVVDTKGEKERNMVVNVKKVTKTPNFWQPR
jgi:hypothetical protein